MSFFATFFVPKIAAKLVSYVKGSGIASFKTEHYGLDKRFVVQLFDVIHQRSINEQKNG